VRDFCLDEQLEFELGELKVEQSMAEVLERSLAQELLVPLHQMGEEKV